MKIIRHGKFRKNFKSRISHKNKLTSQFEERLKLLIANPNNPALRNHRLTGKLKGFKSFALSGDYRVVYKIVNGTSIELHDIGTHNQVY